MKHRKRFIITLILISCLLILSSVSVLAADLTESQVQDTVASQGKETVTGNIFVWFLCAIAFLKVSQKIDSFMASLGVNVGNTGGNMMAELLIAGRSLSNAMHAHRGGENHRTTTPGDAAVGGNFLSGGLAGSVRRQTERSAVNTATGYSSGNSIGNMLYTSSLNKGGDFANNVISNIAKGNYGQVGSIHGTEASKAFASYMGIPAGNIGDYSGIEIGGGRITGTEQTSDGVKDFAMYNTEQYLAPTHGSYETVQSTDGTSWYKQYAQPTVEKTPYETATGKIAYSESIVQKLPQTPSRKDRL